MKRSRITLVVACLALVGAVLVGGWALLVGRSDDPAPAAAAKPAGRATSTASASAKPGPPGKDADGNVTAFAVPKGIVDPTRGRTYCDTVRLLSIYSRQGYGLSRTGTVKNGKELDTRLKVIAVTYGRLADQAVRTPKAGEVASSWRALAVMASDTEEKLRVYGLQLQSQGMIVQLAKLAQTTHAELPKAAATLGTACGYSPAVLGL